MKLIFKLLVLATLVVSANLVFAAQNYPDRVATLTNLKNNVSVGTTANIAVGIYRDTLTKEVTTASEADTTIFVDKFYVDPAKYTGFEVFWKVNSVSTDSLIAAGDTIFPMIWLSPDGTNWTVVTGSTGITQDTITHATVPATALAVQPCYRRYYKSDATPAPVGRYVRIGARYFGNNEDAITAALATYTITLILMKD